MQPVAAGVMSFHTPCFFWNAYNTNTWRALFRPLNLHQHLWRPGSGTAQEFFGVFWPANEASLGWDFTLCFSCCCWEQWVWLCSPTPALPHSYCHCCWNSPCHHKGFWHIWPGGPGQPFQVCIALQLCKNLITRYWVTASSYLDMDCVRNSPGEKAVASQEQQ